jgi:hypothetical protein
LQVEIFLKRATEWPFFILESLFLHRSPPGPDEIKGIAAEIAPEDAEELGIFA